MAEHDYFGVIDETGAERWTELVEANDQQVDVSVWMESAADDDALDRAAAMVMSLDAIDRHARELLVGELASHATQTSQYIAAIVGDVDDEDIVNALDRESGDRAIDILRSMQLASATIRPDLAGDDESFCTLRYHFAPDLFDLTLVAVLDARAESADIRIEAW